MPQLPKTAKDLFLAALDIESAERAAFLDNACAGNAALQRQIEALLRVHDEPDSLLDSPRIDLGLSGDAGPGPAATLDRIIIESPGTVIGPYKLLQQIGEGGMGVVYMAQQTEPVERRVALKIIKPGMDTRQVIARFEAERQALAMMDHPNISKVFDAGTTDSGRPYFVMELVKGVPITQYCDEHQLSPRDRLELFTSVCQAVQHAHQKGIIHRDIKPSNVLVCLYDGKPVPKVIDFGVAKAISQRLTEKTMFTQYGQIVGTLEYMSPEQAELSQLDVDTRSDIYSLGVLLYELLTGETPLDRERLRSAAFDEMLRIIREEEPPKPSLRLTTSESLPSIAANRHTEPKKLSTLVRGELDWIVMKSLDKDRTRRYETANSFAADILRYLADEPVTACPPSAAYRFKKFARRNRGLLFATTVIATALLLGAAISTWQAIRATKAERLAQQRLEAEEDAHEKAHQAARESLGRLFDSYLAQAKASRWSGQPGQRLGSLKAIREAAALIPRLGLGDAERLTLRNEAIAALGLIDLEQQSHVALPRRDWWVTFDPQMKHFACMDASNQLGIWRLADGQRISRLPISVPPTQGAPRKFTQDGRYLVGIGPHPNGWVWDVQRSKLILEFKTSVSAYASKDELFSSRGGVLAVVAADESVQLFDLSNGTQVHCLATQAKSVALSADGTKLAVSSAQNTGIEIWDCRTGLPLRVLNVPFVRVMAWHPHGKYLACTETEEGRYNIDVWDIETGDRCAVLTGHRNEGLDFCFSHDGALLASAGWDGSGRLWAPFGDRELLRTDGERCEFLGHEALMFTNGVEASVWRVCRSPECLTLRPADTRRDVIFRGVDFWWGGPMLANARGDGIRIWNLQSNREVAYAPIGFTDSVLFHQGTCSLISSGSSGVYQWPITVSDDATSWRIGPPRKLSDRKGTRADSGNLARSRDGSRIVATVGYDVAVVLGLADETEPVALQGHADVSHLTVSPDGQWVASVDREGAKIWNAQTGEMVKEIDSDGPAYAVSFGPNGKWLVMVGISHFRLFEVDSWELDRKFAVHEMGRGISWSSDGRLLAVTADNVATLFDPATGRQVARITSPNEAGNIQSLCFSSDDGRLAIVHRTATEVWDLRLVRRRLAEMALDWDLPPLPPPVSETTPQRVQFDLGTLAPQSRRENYMEKARLHAMREDWQAAAEDYAKAFESGTTDLEYLFEIAAGLLIGGKPDKYREVCRSMFQEHGQTDNDRTAYLLARSATFGHDEYGNPDTRRLATLAVESSPHCAWYLHTLGMACYREGQYPEAVEYLEKSAQQRWEAHIANWIALAMAYHHLGEHDKSQQRWLQAGKWLEKPQALHPHDRVAVKVLHDEAKAVLEPADNENQESADETPTRAPEATKAQEPEDNDSKSTTGPDEETPETEESEGRHQEPAEPEGQPTAP